VIKEKSMEKRRSVLMKLILGIVLLGALAGIVISCAPPGTTPPTDPGEVTAPQSWYDTASLIMNGIEGADAYAKSSVVIPPVGSAFNNSSGARDAALSAHTPVWVDAGDGWFTYTYTQGSTNNVYRIRLINNDPDQIEFQLNGTTTLNMDTVTSTETTAVTLSAAKDSDGLWSGTEVITLKIDVNNNGSLSSVTAIYTFEYALLNTANCCGQYQGWLKGIRDGALICDFQYCDFTAEIAAHAPPVYVHGRFTTESNGTYTDYTINGYQVVTVPVVDTLPG
jgi:hypothetical protein